MTEPFIGQIQQFGFNFNPRGWAFCNGATLPIQQNTALFALLTGLALWSWPGAAPEYIPTLAGWVIFGQALDAAALIGMALIVAGIVVMNLFSSTGSP